MADAYRAKPSALSSAKAIYGAKGKSARLAASKNQQPGQSSVLPRIDRRGEAPPKLQPLVSPRTGALSILLPPPRPPSKLDGTSPTYHDDDVDGPSAKAAWSTPRAPPSDLATGSHVASFFATPEEGGDRDEGPATMPTPLRLQSVESSINANEERYRVDMEQLLATNDKFFEISMSANQHLEQMNNQLPSIADAFEQTASALQDLSIDIATLHEQHENAQQELTNQFDAKLNNNAEEMMALSAAHADERSELCQRHERELLDAEDLFREKITELEDKHRQAKEVYANELQELRQTSSSQLQALRETSQAEKEEQEALAKATIDAIQSQAKAELEELQSRTQAAYQELEGRSQEEYAELQRTSLEELAAVKAALTSEILSLKTNSAADLAALTAKSERELRELRQEHDETLHSLQTRYAAERAELVEKAAEEITRLHMFEIDQSAQIEARRCRETKTLRDALQAAHTDYSSQIQGLHRRYTSQLEALKATSEGEKASLLKAHATETERMKEAAASELSQTVSSSEEKLRSLTETHEAEVNQHRKESTRERDGLIAKHEAEMTSLQNDWKREKDSLILHYETELDALKRSSREEHESQELLHEAQLAQLRDSHSSKVLALEMAMREQNKQAEETIREKDSELDERQARISELEASERALSTYQAQFAEQSREGVEQKSMAMCELDAEIWRLEQLNQDKDALLEKTSRELKAASEDLQVKASTILELTFVIKSRDDEIEKLRNALLDTVQTVNTKTEILELTTETLSSKAKELEATKNALRMESGRLSMVEESMHQKEGLLENTELKMESMRLNMENMRLEMKRMQMDMKLQLEHTEGEIELKNGEIRRLHGANSELKQKNDFCQQTIERLEESLAFAQRQGEEAQRRIDLLRLEATQAADEVKKVRDQLLSKEQDFVILSGEKQTVSSEKQQLQIEFNNLTHVAQILRERIELHMMQGEEIRSQSQQQLYKIIAEKDERLRFEKHLLTLELSAAKDMIRHLEGVEERLTESSKTAGALASEKQHLEAEVVALNETLRKYEHTDRLLREATEEIELKTGLIETKAQEVVRLNDRIRRVEDETFHRLDASRMELEDAMSVTNALMISKEELMHLSNQLRSRLSDLRAEKEQLMVSLGQEKREVVARAENLQEKLAGMRAEGVRAANEISDLQHALNEKKKELAYLQENLAEQTAETRKVKSVLGSLSASYEELQERFTSLSSQRDSENRSHEDTIQSLQQSLRNKVDECESLQKSVEEQRQEHRQLLDDLRTNHDSQATQLIAGYHSQLSQLSEDNRNQLAQLAEDHRTHLAQLISDHRAYVAQLTDDHRTQLARSAEDHRVQVTQLMDERSKQAEEIAQLKVEHLAQMVQLTGDRESQVAQLTEDLRSQVSQLAEDHRSAVAQLEDAHHREIEQLKEGHRSQVAQLEEGHINETQTMAEHHRSEVAQLEETRRNEVTRLNDDHESEVGQLKESHRGEVTRLEDSHLSEVSQLKESYESKIARSNAEHREELSRLSKQLYSEVARLSDERRTKVKHMEEAHRREIDHLKELNGADATRMDEDHRAEFNQQAETHRSEVAQLVETHEAEVAQIHETYSNEIAQLTESNQGEIMRLNEEHAALFSQLQEQYRAQLAQMETDRKSEWLRLEESHRSEIDQLIEAHRSYVVQLRAEHFDGLGILQEEYEGKLKEIDAAFMEKTKEQRAVTQTVKSENHQLRIQHQATQSRALGQQQILLQQAVDERIRVVCSHSLELMTLRVAHQHEMASMEQHSANSRQAYSKQLGVLRSQNSQLKADYAQRIKDITDQHASEAAAIRRGAEEQSQQAREEHKRAVDELIATHTQDMELLRLRLAEEHLLKVNELLERARTEDERHKEVLAVTRHELDEKEKTVNHAEETATALKATISELESQLSQTKQEVVEREADIEAKAATIDNVRKELALFLETAKSTRSSEQFVALLRQQLETHLMEAYHVKLHDLEDFVLENESDLLNCLKAFFAMRCYRGVAPPRSDSALESNGAVTSVDNIRSRLHEYDRVVTVLDRMLTSLDASELRLPASEKVALLQKELRSLKVSVGNLFVCSADTASRPEEMDTNVWVQLLSHLTGLCKVLALPNDVESVLARGREVIRALEDNEKLLRTARTSCIKDDIRTMDDICHLFSTIDAVLARARDVTHSDHIGRLQDLFTLFDEWDALHKEMDAAAVVISDEESTLPDDAVSRPGNYLRSNEILTSRQEAAKFVQQCKSALELADDDDVSPDDIVEAIQLLMKILQHFELLQPKLGSPRRRPTSPAVTELPPTIESKVTAVLGFVEELQLMAEFAQNILEDESKGPQEPESNESSQSSLEALRALARTPSPAPTLDELQIDVDLAIDDAMDDDPNHCEFSRDEGEKQRDAFFAVIAGDSSSRSPSPFLADSLMDISLVMNEHQQLLSQTARWVAKSRQGVRGQKFSLGTEIARLVREHCALLSLSRRLFKMKDPRQELVSLLEGVALLERLTARLALFQAPSAQDPDDMSCQNSCFGDNSIVGSESAASIDRSDIDSASSSPRSMLASIGDMARHLQDYDYFLKQIKAEAGRVDTESNSPASINIEELVHELNDRVTLVEKTKELLGLDYPNDELPQFLIGAQEVLRQAKVLREESVCSSESVAKREAGQQETESVNEHSSRDTGDEAVSGVETILNEMDAVVEDLRTYNDLLAWMKDALPSPESVKSVNDLKTRIRDVLAQVETLSSDKSRLAQEKTRLESDLVQVEMSRDGLVQQSSKEGELLMELTALQSTALEASTEEASIRLEVLKTLIENQRNACNEAEQRRADERAEATFLRQHELLSEDATREEKTENVVLSVHTRIGIYRRLLDCIESLRSEKSAVEAEKNSIETSLSEAIQSSNSKLESVEEELLRVQREMAGALAEEREFLESTDAFASFLTIESTADGAFSRINVYQELHGEIARLVSDKHAAESRDAREYEFLQAHNLLSSWSDERACDGAVPSSAALSSARLSVFQQLVHFLERQTQQSEQLAQELSQESKFLHENSLAFDVSEAHNSRLAVYGALLAGQNALIDEKMEREVAAQSETAFLVSHGLPAFDTTMEAYEQFVHAQQQHDALAVELREEHNFLLSNELCSSEDVSGASASLTTSFSSSLRLSVYQNLLQTIAQAQEENRLLQERMEQRLREQATGFDLVIASLTRKIERLETTLMWWQESAFASQKDWNLLLMDEEESRRSLIQYFDKTKRDLQEKHDRELEKVCKARDTAEALVAATHAEALEHAAKQHEARLAAELQKQAQQLELAALAHAEHEARKQPGETTTISVAPSLSSAQMRAQLLEKFAKRDTAAISMIYKAIRLATDILSSSTTPAGRSASSEISTDVTQTVLSCVKELKALKEYLVQSLEHIVRDDDHAPPPFAHAPFAKWMADAVARATADKESAIDLALCSHREFMSFAEVQLLSRQDEAEQTLARLFDKLKAVAANGAFTAEQEKLLALELEVTREKEARENVACKFRLNEEYYRRLLDERKEMEIAQAATVVELREESKTLRSKLEKLELQLQQQIASPQFRPPSGNVHASAQRPSVVSPRVLKTAAVPTGPMPMRPERPRGGGSAHKERYVSDLEKETGQRRTSAAARRLNDWKAREDTIAENAGTQLEQDFRALQVAATAYHTPALEPVVPTLVTAPATAPGSSLQNQELWYQGVRSIQYVSFFISVFHVPRQQLFRVEVFNSDTEQQQQTVYVTWAEMQAFLQENRKAVRLGIALPTDPELALTVPQHVRSEIMDVLFGRVRVYGEGSENILLGFE